MWDPRTYHDTDFGLDQSESFEPDTAECDEAWHSVELPHVMTLLGPIAPEELGICLPHVHLLCDPPGVIDDFRLNQIDRAEAEIESYVTVNGRSLVECSTRDMGRDVSALLEIAGWVPAHLIGATGRHGQMHSLLPVCDHAELAEQFVFDLTTGMDGTSARAGVIVVGFHSAMISVSESETLMAAADAHQTTGSPISIHVGGSASAGEIVGQFTRAGVQPGYLIVGSCDRLANDESSLLTILESGAFIQFDQIGITGAANDQHLADLVTRLCKQGFGNQILLSLDYDRRSLQVAWDGGPGLPYLSEWFMVLLMESGLEASTIRQLVIENPARALTIHRTRTTANN